MVINYWDFVIAPVYIIVLIIFANYVRLRNEHRSPEYKYFTCGLYAKIFGGISVCFIYTYYYNGGDTINYFTSTEAFANLLEKNPADFWRVLTERPTPENYNLFDTSTGFPLYWWDPRSTMVAKLLVPVYYLGLKSYLGSTIVLAAICYSGIWKMYQLFCEVFPKIKSQLAITILFIPSVVFWGSGMLKDTITISAVGWYTYCFYYCLIRFRYTPKNIAGILLSSYLLIAIKPYIFFALLPGSIIWLSNVWISAIRSSFLRLVAAPVLIVAGLGGGFYILLNMSDSLGVYSVDTVMQRAVDVQSDLKKDYYGGNTFDIGEFDSSVGSMLGVSHKAIEATLFRPYIWEAKNVVMVLSGIENILILLFTLFLLMRMRVVGFFFYIWKDPMLLFAVTFSLFFAFSVGISTPNFGSLVRLKIPCIPFFISSLTVLNFYYRDKKPRPA
jgi:hypothetical protein